MKTKEQRQKAIEDFLKYQRMVYELQYSLKQANEGLKAATEVLAPYIEEDAGEVIDGYVFDKVTRYEISLQKNGDAIKKKYPSLVKEVLYPNRLAIIDWFNEGKKLDLIKVTKYFKITTETP